MWGPAGETKNVKTPVTKSELLGQLELHPSVGLRDFIAVIQDGDELYLETDGNNHSGYCRYVGRRKDSITYVYVVSAYMS